MTKRPYFWCVWPCYSGPHSDSILRESHTELLAAAKMAFCMVREEYKNTPPYKALVAAIAKAEEAAS